MDKYLILLGWTDRRTCAHTQSSTTVLCVVDAHYDLLPWMPQSVPFSPWDTSPGSILVPDLEGHQSATRIALAVGLHNNTVHDDTWELNKYLEVKKHK